MPRYEGGELAKQVAGEETNQPYLVNEKLSNDQFIIVDFPDKKYQIKFDKFPTFRGGQGSIHHGWLYPYDQKKPSQEVAVKIHESEDSSVDEDEFALTKKAGAANLIPEQVLALSELHKNDNAPLKIKELNANGIKIIVFEWANPLRVRTLKARIIETFTFPGKTAAEPLSLNEVRSLILQLGAFITVQAEKNGIIHYDLKPSNLYEDDDGQLLVGDFGLTKKVGDVTDITTIHGTMPYLPFWRFLDQPVLINETLELPAAAIVVYELLTGKNPYGLLSTPVEYMNAARELVFGTLDQKFIEQIRDALANVWHLGDGLPPDVAAQKLDSTAAALGSLFGKAWSTSQDQTKHRRVKIEGISMELIELENRHFKNVADFCVQLAKLLPAPVSAAAHH